MSIWMKRALKSLPPVLFAGGVALLFSFNALGAGPKTSTVGIDATYRKVPGTAGGL